MLSTLVNIIAAPKLAYQHLIETPSVLLPMVLLLATVSLTTFTYFQLSDPEFVIDDMVEQAGQGVSDAERAEMRQGMESMGGDTLKWFAILGGTFSVLAIFVLHAGYYYLTSMFNGTKIGFKRWLSFIVWSSVPHLFGNIASLSTLLLSTSHTALSDLNPLTFYNLLGIDLSNTEMPRVLSNFDLTMLWSMVLMLIGYRIWTAKSWLHASLVVIFPMLSVYGILVFLES